MINIKDLKDFSNKVLRAVNCSEAEASIASDVLVEADARGIYSHGTARLQRYCEKMSSGSIEVGKEPKIVYETPISVVIDGNNGVGQYVSDNAVKLCIQKANEKGFCMVTVRNSNHYGIAGYYAEKGLAHDMIGFSATNTTPLVIPTFGKTMLLGTNPIAVSFPTDNKPVLIDMATSVVPRGKLEVYSRLNKKMPHGWATDEKGISTDDPSKILKNITGKKGGGILPLGGEGEEHGGHKGYGLALMVELLTAGISMGSYSHETYTNKGGISHIFAMIKLDLFGSPKDIKRNISRMIDDLRRSEKASGQDRIYIHGEKESEARQRASQDGIRLDKETVMSLKGLSQEYKVEWPEGL